MDVSQTGSRLLLDVSAEECWSLAVTEPVGRLAWSGPAGPQVVPVNFEVTDRRVLVRTAAYSALARECDDSPVAFEVDHYDAETRSGWSVVMRGHAHVDYSGGRGIHDPDVWAPGARALRVVIAVAVITRRRVSRPDRWPGSGQVIEQVRDAGAWSRRSPPGCGC